MLSNSTAPAKPSRLRPTSAYADRTRPVAEIRSELSACSPLNSRLVFGSTLACAAVALLVSAVVVVVSLVWRHLYIVVIHRQTDFEHCWTRALTAHQVVQAD